MVVSQTDVPYVSMIFREMKNKSSGHDGISYEILKCSLSIIEGCIVKASNKCIEERTYPECFKVANIGIMHKKGDKHSPEITRPLI